MRESYDALVDTFECIENFLRRLKVYTEIQPTPAMTEMAIKIMVELLAVLALATKQVSQGRFSKSIVSMLTATHGLNRRREICEEVVGRKGD